MNLTKEHLQELIKINGHISVNSGSSSAFYENFLIQTEKAISKNVINDENNFYKNEVRKIVNKVSGITSYEDQAKYFIETFKDKIKIPDVFTILDIKRNSYGKDQKDVDSRNINFLITLVGEDTTFNMLQNYLYEKYNNNKFPTNEIVNNWFECLQKKPNFMDINKAELIIKKIASHSTYLDSIIEKKQSFKKLVFLHEYVDVADEIKLFFNKNKTNAVFEKFAKQLIDKKTKIDITEQDHQIIDREIITGVIKVNGNYLISKFGFNKNNTEKFLEHLYFYISEKYNKKEYQDCGFEFNRTSVSIITVNIDLYKEVSTNINKEINAIMKLANHWNTQSSMENSFIFFKDSINKIQLYNELKNDNNLSKNNHNKMKI